MNEKELLNTSENTSLSDEKRLRELCGELMRERYGEELPGLIAKRLEDELKIIAQRDLGPAYLLAHGIARECRNRNIPYLARGEAGSSLAAFLLGITHTNPLPPHLYCPECRYVDFDYDAYFPDNGKAKEEDAVSSGFDLVSAYQSKIICPECTEAELIGDGHDIPFESFLGVSGGTTFGGKPKFWIDVPKECKNEIKSRLIDLCAAKPFSPKDIESADIVGSDLLSGIKRLCELTGVSDEEIPIDGVPYNEFINGELRADISELDCIPEDITDSLSGTCFSDIVRAFGYSRGTGVWEDNAERVLLEHPYAVERTIAHREDVMQTLMRHGIEREKAFRIMWEVKRGNARGLPDDDFTEMKGKGVPEEFICSMMKIRYVLPRAHSIEHAIKTVKLMYFRKNFPEEYGRVLEEFG